MADLSKYGCPGCVCTRTKEDDDWVPSPECVHHRSETHDDGPKLIIGSLVHLKSGGPMMSVEAIKESTMDEDRTQIHCVWFGDNGLRDRGIFDSRTLKLDR